MKVSKCGYHFFCTAGFRLLDWVSTSVALVPNLKDPRTCRKLISTARGTIFQPRSMPSQIALGTPLMHPSGCRLERSWSVTASCCKAVATASAFDASRSPNLIILTPSSKSVASVSAKSTSALDADVDAGLSSPDFCIAATFSCAVLRLAVRSISRFVGRKPLPPCRIASAAYAAFFSWVAFSSGGNSA